MKRPKNVRVAHWVMIAVTIILFVLVAALVDLKPKVDENFFFASDDPQFHLDILKGMSEALKGRQSVKMPAGWPEASAKLSKSPNPDVRSLTASLSTLFGDVKSLDAARKIAADKSASADARAKALSSLLDAKVKDLAPLLQQLLEEL